MSGPFSIDTKVQAIGSGIKFGWVTQCATDFCGSERFRSASQPRHSWSAESANEDSGPSTRIIFNQERTEWLATFASDCHAPMIATPTSVIPSNDSSIVLAESAKYRARKKCLTPFVRSTRRAGSRQKGSDTYFPPIPSLRCSRQSCLPCTAEGARDIDGSNRRVP